ncbi:hypothetical protein O181_084823 [Austropuccinia psidii MF-1]|uniref:Reverse transcriptase Ty1/copia-type domain-containing protein n=1 Tax=Austropuccinia psidii MF-1 TaxID=1389203 RepID=A0A9Q3IL09_9BASI|nr:hypothetical protein [Austropuccinia psidii MF-1]
MVYLVIPQGLGINCWKFCLRLNEVIYGLKQALLAWYTCLKDWLQSINFVVCKLDPCIFYQKTIEPLWVYVHIDEMAIFGRNAQPFKDQVNREFSIKDTGPADLPSGVKIQHLKEGITLYQQNFVDSLLDLYGMKNCKPVATPLVPNEHIRASTVEEEEVFKRININFRSAVGSIN